MSLRIALKIITCSLVLTCFVFPYSESFSWTYVRFYEKILKKFNINYTEQKQLHSGYGAPDYFLMPPPEKYFTQPLDHFDAMSEGTFKQRYWCNPFYFIHPKGPVFLYIGGEGSMNAETAIFGEHVELAKTYGALVFVVEHRFYGKSRNLDGLQLKNLQHLSSQQALADLANFRSFAVKEYNLTEENLWISFGGSYAGMLSAWFRIKYPHLVYASVASSAPVHAMLDFPQYNDVVAQSLADESVQGSATCLRNVAAAFREIDQLLLNRSYSKLEKDFETCDKFAIEADRITFGDNLADVIRQTVQYNLEVPGLTIGKICEEMTLNERSVYESLQILNKLFLKQTDSNCTSNSWNQFILDLSKENGTLWMTGLGYRQWIYQTCTQFGYYQTCPSNSSCPFSHLHTLESDLEICDSVFGIKPITTQRAVEFTNEYYGSNNPRGSRIVFVNGLVDPWHALSVLKNISVSEVAMIIHDGAHCANMISSKTDDRPDLINARKKIAVLVGQWLKGTQKAK